MKWGELKSTSSWETWQVKGFMRGKGNILKSTSSWETWLSILKFRVFPSNWNPQVHEKLDGDSKEVAQALEIEIHKFMRNLTAKILFTC